MRILRDVFRRKIRLTDERVNHIKDSHPEMTRQFGKIGATLLKPDRVVRSISDDTVDLFYRFYRSTPVGEKYLCVAVKGIENDYFMLTAYFTDSIKKGELLWTIGRK